MKTRHVNDNFKQKLTNIQGKFKAKYFYTFTVNERKLRKNKSLNIMEIYT